MLHFLPVLRSPRNKIFCGTICNKERQEFCESNGFDILIIIIICLILTNKKFSKSILVCVIRHQIGINYVT